MDKKLRASFEKENKMKTLWFRLCRNLLISIPYPYVHFELYRKGKEIKQQIKLFGMVVARGQLEIDSNLIKKGD